MYLVLDFIQLTAKSENFPNYSIALVFTLIETLNEKDERVQDDLQINLNGVLLNKTELNNVQKVIKNLIPWFSDKLGKII